MNISNQHFFEVKQAPVQATIQHGRNRQEVVSTTDYYGVIADSDEVKEPFLTVRTAKKKDFENAESTLIQPDNPTLLLTHKQADTIAKSMTNILGKNRFIHLQEYDAPLDPGKTFFRVYRFDQNLTDWFKTWNKQHQQFGYKDESFVDVNMYKDQVKKHYAKLWEQFDSVYRSAYEDTSKQQESLIENTNNNEWRIELPLDDIELYVAVSNGYDESDVASFELMVKTGFTKDQIYKDTIKEIFSINKNDSNESNDDTSVSFIVLCSASIKKDDLKKIFTSSDVEPALQTQAEKIATEFERALVVFALFYNLLAHKKVEHEDYLIAVNLDIHNVNRSTKIKYSPEHRRKVRSIIEKNNAVITRYKDKSYAALIKYLIFDMPFDIRKFQIEKKLPAHDIRVSLRERNSYKSILDTFANLLTNEKALETYAEGQLTTYHTVRNDI
jgi:hypothetical protein